jgi:Tfp pilus assembly protein FimT
MTNAAERSRKAADTVPKAKGSTLIGLLITLALLAMLAALSAVMMVSCIRLN